MELLTHCHIDHMNWVERLGPPGEPVQRGKNRVNTLIKANTGLDLEVCCKAGGKCGTSTDGPQGRRFFSEELVESIGQLAGNR